MYTYRVEQAIKAATVLHDGQYRKGPIAVPFVSHVLSVAMLLREFTDDETTIVAAVLHDTLEDTDYTVEELTEDFGKDVAELVLTLTEPPKSEVSDWLERKKIYAEQLKHGSVAAVQIAAVDKMHNFRSMVEDYYNDHNAFLQDFGKKIDLRLEAYQRISNVINNRLDGPIINEFNNVFETYKEFLYEIEKHADPLSL